MSNRAGIVGTGGIAGMGILGMHDADEVGRERVEASHAGGYAAVDDIDLVAVADVDEEALARFGDLWEIPDERRYEDHEAMLEHEALDVVSVCTPTYLHHDHVVDAVRLGEPDVVWCEKPIASSVTDAEAMIDACEESGTELLVNHSFRFTAKVRRLRNALQEGLLGDVRSVNVTFRRELLRNSTHLLDLLVYFLDARAERVSGYINGENDAVESLGGDRAVDDAGGGGTVVMDDGTFTTIDCTVAREISTMSLQFVGTEGKLLLNNDDGEWRYWRLVEGEHVEEDIPDIDEAWTWDRDYAAAFPTAAEHVAELLEGETENRSPGVEAMRSLEIIVGFYLSHYTGSHVSIPLDRPLRDVTITSW